jgi:cobalt/nickel transport system permease protein
VKHSFVERSIEGLFEAMERALYAESVAAGGGLLQRLDPRVKLAGLIGLVAAAALSARIAVIAAVFAIAIVLAALSRVSISTLATRVWIEALAFTGVIAVPAIFLTPGRMVYEIPALGWPVTAQGLTSAGYLILRVETAATLSLLLIFTTPWMHVLKALRVFRVPVVFVVVLGMSCRYILLMLESAHEMFDSRRSRTVGTLDGPERRRLAAATAGVMLSKAFQMSGEVYLAMQARGFRGEVYLLDDFCMKPRDWIALSGFAGASALAIWAGR